MVYVTTELKNSLRKALRLPRFTKKKKAVLKALRLKPEVFDL
jgi:hypothetical protein